MDTKTFLEPTTSTFDAEVLSSETPVLVDFWAPWCGPCRAFKPTVEAVAAEKADDLKVAFVNVDENPELAERYDILSIPALRLFKGGEIVAGFQGAKSRQEFEAWLEANGI